MSRVVRKYRLLALTILMVNALLADCQRVTGVNVVGPFDESLNEGTIAALKALDVGWVGFTPEYMIDRQSLEIVKEHVSDEWTHTIDGYRTFIQDCKSADLKVVLKPHIVVGKTRYQDERLVDSTSWRGDLLPIDERLWDVIEANYTAYILEIAQLAADEEVEVFFIGTEMKTFVEHRPQYWSELITDVNAIYSGYVSYSANWDNYQVVPFWEELDFIGVNAYFPINDNKVPTVRGTISNWQPIITEMRDFSDQYGKQVLLTEYGYRSIDHAGAEPWLHVGQTPHTEAVEKAQYNLLRAFYESIWQQPFVAGGMLWNWPQVSPMCGNTDFTIQDKAAQDLLKVYFKE